MDVAVEARGANVAVAQLKGRLDLVAAPAVKQRLAEAIAEGHRNLVVDLGEVSFVDSSGLSALISALKSARQANGDVRLARAADQPRTVIRMLALDRVMRTFATVEEALAGY
jgi:anti-anti-sigma factor